MIKKFLGWFSKSTKKVEPVKEEAPPKVVYTVSVPKILSLDGKYIPLALEELPDYIVFEAMFNKQFGYAGEYQIIIQGESKFLNCEQLYCVLETIITTPDPSPTLTSLYGTVLSTVLFAHVETLDSRSLN